MSGSLICRRIRRVNTALQKMRITMTCESGRIRATSAIKDSSAPRYFLPVAHHFLYGRIEGCHKPSVWVFPLPNELAALTFHDQLFARPDGHPELCTHRD